jgi:hypothetical protein
MTDNFTISHTPRPNLSENYLEEIAKLHGRQVVVCYGGEKGFNIAKFLKCRNPYRWINFIVAPISIPLGETPPIEGVLENEIKESHSIVVLFDKKGFFKSVTAKKEFRIILEYKKSRYIPIFLKRNEKKQMIEMVKEEFGVDLLKDKQYGIWNESYEFLENLYDSIRRKVIEI